MTPTRTRRLSTVIAGCVAMAASLTALGAIVIADVAEAKEVSDVTLLDDALPLAPPVKVTKLVAKAEPEPTLEELLQPFDEPLPAKSVKSAKRSKRKPPIDFGAFEGY